MNLHNTNSPLQESIHQECDLIGSIKQKSIITAHCHVRVKMGSGDMCDDIMGDGETSADVTPPMPGVTPPLLDPTV